jgi:hypothetical protein
MFLKHQILLDVVLVGGVTFSQPEEIIHTY